MLDIEPPSASAPCPSPQFHHRTTKYSYVINHISLSAATIFVQPFYFGHFFAHKSCFISPFTPLGKLRSMSLVNTHKLLRGIQLINYRLLLLLLLHLVLHR